MHIFHFSNVPGVSFYSNISYISEIKNHDLRTSLKCPLARLLVRCFIKSNTLQRVDREREALINLIEAAASVLYLFSTLYKLSMSLKDLTGS